MSAITELSGRLLTAPECVAVLPEGQAWSAEVAYQLGLWVPAGEKVYLVDSYATCGRAGRQEFPGIAVVVELQSHNPGIILCRPVWSEGLLARLLEYVRSRPWEG